MQGPGLSIAGPPRFVESSLELVTRRQLEEQDQLEQAIELQTKWLAEPQLADRKRSQISYVHR